MIKHLGKIKTVKFGFGGRDNCMVGLHMVLEGKDWGVNVSESCFENHLSTERGNILDKTLSLLRDAKIHTVDALEGKPVEATFGKDGTLTAYRILIEVL